MATVNPCLTTAITAELWKKLDERLRHAWRRSVLTGGKSRVRGVVSVVVDPAVIREVDVEILARALAESADLDLVTARTTVLSSRVGVLPLVVAAAVPFDHASRISAAIVGVPHEIVPCDPDPTWKNDGPWWMVPLVVVRGRTLVHAEGSWSPFPNRRWYVWVNGEVCMQPLTAKSVADLLIELGTFVHPENVHPAFRARVQTRLRGRPACPTSDPSA